MEEDEENMYGIRVLGLVSAIPGTLTNVKQMTSSWIDRRQFSKKMNLQR